MAKISVVVRPYAFQCGEIEIPDYIKENDYRNYIVKNWNDINFSGLNLDYCDPDFDYKRTESN